MSLLVLHQYISTKFESYYNSWLINLLNIFKHWILLILKGKILSLSSFCLAIKLIIQNREERKKKVPCQLWDTSEFDGCYTDQNGPSLHCIFLSKLKGHILMCTDTQETQFFINHTHQVGPWYILVVSVVSL